MHSSMCAKTASTEASGSASGLRTLCTAVVIRSSTPWERATLRSCSSPAGLKSVAWTVKPLWAKNSGSRPCPAPSSNTSSIVMRERAGVSEFGTASRLVQAGTAGPS